MRMHAVCLFLNILLNPSKMVCLHFEWKVRIVIKNPAATYVTSLCPKNNYIRPILNINSWRYFLNRMDIRIMSINKSLNHCEQLKKLNKLVNLFSWFWVGLKITSSDFKQFTCTNIREDHSCKRSLLSCFIFCCKSARSRPFCTLLYMFLLFVPGTNKIKYCFEKSNKISWVATNSAGRSLEGQQTIFYFRPNRRTLYQM